MPASSATKVTSSMRWRSTTLSRAASHPTLFFRGALQRISTEHTSTGATAMIGRILSYMLGVAAISSSLCTPSLAGIEFGTGIFCDTQQQVERFVAVFTGDMQAAANAVNAEENDPTACVLGTIAYVRAGEIATARTRTRTYNILRVIVVGFLTEQ